MNSSYQDHFLFSQVVEINRNHNCNWLKFPKDLILATYIATSPVYRFKVLPPNPGAVIPDNKPCMSKQICSIRGFFEVAKHFH